MQYPLKAYNYLSDCVKERKRKKEKKNEITDERIQRVSKRMVHVGMCHCDQYLFNIFHRILYDLQDF